MTRCPACREANPDSRPVCARCGARMPARPPRPTLAELAEPGAALRAWLAVLPAMALYGLLFNWVYPTIPRLEGRLFVYFSALGLCAGLCLAWTRGEAGRWQGWALLGLASGWASYAVDFLYSYHTLVYRGVFHLADFLGLGGEILFPFRVLQVLRLLAGGLVLALGFAAWRRRRGLLPQQLGGLALACLVRAWVRGFPMPRPAAVGWGMDALRRGLAGPGNRLGVEGLFLYCLSLWILFYAFSRKRPVSY